MPDVPRLTRSLRAFTDLGRKREPQRADLTKKRLEQASKLTHKLSWKEFCKHLPKTAAPLLSKIRNEAAKFCAANKENTSIKM